MVESHEEYVWTPAMDLLHSVYQQHIEVDDTVVYLLHRGLSHL